MRPLHILNTPADSRTKQEITARLQKFEPNDQRMDYLIKEISGGNSQLIDELLVSAEEIVLKVILTMPESKYCIDDRLSHAAATLKKLVLTSANNPSRQLFERFCVFHARQSLLALDSDEIGQQ